MTSIHMVRSYARLGTSRSGVNDPIWGVCCVACACAPVGASCTIKVVEALGEVLGFGNWQVADGARPCPIPVVHHTDTTGCGRAEQEHEDSGRHCWIMRRVVDRGPP